MWTGASPSTRAILPLPCQSKVEHLPFAAFEYVVEVQGIFREFACFSGEVLKQICYGIFIHLNWENFSFGNIDF
jgi:hypothetical protein